MNIEDQSPATATTEQATIQATVVRDNNVMDLQGIDTPDSNCSKQVMNMENVYGKIRIRSSECDISSSKNLAKIFIGCSRPNVSWTLPMSISIGVMEAGLRYL